MKCEIPSFVADFVLVTYWVDSTGKSYYPENDYGIDIDLLMKTIVL